MQILQPLPNAQPFRNTLKRCALHCGILICVSVCCPALLLAQTAQQYLRNGDRQVAANQYQQAVQSYLSATKLQPDNADAYGKLASVYEKLGLETVEQAKISG